MGNNNRSNFNTDTAGVVEIANIRRAFYTPTYGTPDLLFSWLLNSARDALEFTGGGQHQKKETVGHKPSHPPEMYMAGLLLCDENFIPAAVLKTYDHHYKLDFIAGTIQLRTQLYAVAQKSASFFEGRILESTFVARHAVTDRVLVQISEEEIQKPNFFGLELPFLCFHT
ncbi:MAG: hypothetical protein O7A06_14230 [Acidobacteria bacterium]|nr:hypothetical protein [Acidobacteriota bacterium]MCZ6491672.1 hypothetical protein [Acidobacteriota bacterium]MCZ6750615.1 hypothetical protein [Acidobacteriota bacterium]